MKTMIGMVLILGSLTSVPSFAKGNVLASAIEVGTEFKVLKKLSFPQQSTLTRIQDGNVSSDVNPSNAYCTISVMDTSSESIESGTIFKLHSHLDGDASKGSTGFLLVSDNGREVHMQCRRGVTVNSRLTNYLGLFDLATDNTAQLRVNKLKRILGDAISLGQN